MKKEVSIEDNFQMAYIQPECHSSNFTNEYYLSIKVEYDTIFQCFQPRPPAAKMKMAIVPIISPDCFGYQPAVGFDPIELEPLVNLKIKKLPDEDQTEGTNNFNSGELVVR